MTHAPSLRRSALRSIALAALLAAAPASAEPFLVEVAQNVAPQADGDILDVAAASGQFQTFLAAVQAAGYEETLRGEGPFTVFAPTDAAFEDMGEAEVDRLMQPAAHEELLALLAYHVVPDRVTSAGVEGQVARPEAASGYRLEIDGRTGLRVNDELVVLPDIEASNGVIQGINAVLAPPVLVAAR
ncbi:MAG: fasciclin domain-containing protein [Terricaulis sp.]